MEDKKYISSKQLHLGDIADSVKMMHLQQEKPHVPNRPRLALACNPGYEGFVGKSGEAKSYLRPNRKVWDKSGLPAAGRVEMRANSSVKKCFAKDNKDVSEKLQPGHMVDHSSCPESRRGIRHGKLRDCYRNNSDVIIPKVETRWQTERENFLSEVNGSPFNKRPVGKSVMRDELKGWEKPRAGKALESSGDGYGIVQPNIPALQVEENGRINHDQYVLTHNSYDPGEKKNRNYEWNGEDKFTKTMGRKTDAGMDTNRVKKILEWEHEAPANPTNKVVSLAYQNRRDLFGHKLGKVRDPNAPLRLQKLNPNHRFGLKEAPQSYGAFECMYGRNPTDTLHGKEKLLGLAARARWYIKRANHYNFERIQDAFDNFDRDRKGYLTADDVQKACWRFDIPLDGKVLRELMKICWLEHGQDPSEFDINTATLDIEKFMRKLTIHDFHQDYCTWETFGAVANDYLVKMGNYNRLMLCQKQLVRCPNPTQHLTTSSEVGAGYPQGKESFMWHMHGVPTKRTDLAEPKCVSLSDGLDYGDRNIYELMRPSVFHRCGVYERDLMELREKAVCKRLMCRFGPKIAEATFEKMWPLAVKMSNPERGGAGEKASVQACQMILRNLARKVPLDNPAELRVTKNVADKRSELVI